MPSEHLKKCMDHAKAAEKTLGDHVKEVMADNEKYKQGRLIKLVLDAAVQDKKKRGAK